jgi:hypothetical protein
VTQLTVFARVGVHHRSINPVEQPMPKSPSTSLRVGAVVFAVLWTLWMLSWSGSHDRVSTVMLLICGAAAGYAWYLAMRRQLQRKGLSPREDDSAN